MKKSYKLLSYHLSRDTQGYGDTKEFKIEKKQRLSVGDSCNTSILHLPNHLGTHIDCPRHFFDSGKSVCDYRIKDFIFSKPIILDCPKKDNGIITEEEIKNNRKRLKGKDILLLRTGFYRFRGTCRYSTQNPGIAPQAARFIRNNFVNIRCVGIDFISVSPYSNRKIGCQTHRIFLNKDTFKGQPVFIIEDMDISGDMDSLKKVFVVPLFIKEVDSSLCTVFGVF